MSAPNDRHPFDLFLESIDLRFRDGDGDVDAKRAENELVDHVRAMYADVTGDLLRSPRPKVELPSLEHWLAEDVHYEWFSPVLHPFVGRHRGRAAVIAQIERNFSALVDQVPEVQRIVAQGTDVAVILHETGRLAENARRYTADIVQIFTLAHGQVTRFQTYGHMDVHAR